jgi:hypothetical protein
MERVMSSALNFTTSWNKWYRMLRYLIYARILG